MDNVVISSDNPFSPPLSIFVNSFEFLSIWSEKIAYQSVNGVHLPIGVLNLEDHWMNSECLRTESRISVFVRFDILVDFTSIESAIGRITTPIVYPLSRIVGYLTFYGKRIRIGTKYRNFQILSCKYCCTKCYLHHDKRINNNLNLNLVSNNLNYLST